MIPIRTHAIAKAAYRQVDTRRNHPDRKQYGALAHALPGMILQNGLAQATGFLLAKGGAEHRALLDDLNAVLEAAGVVSALDGEKLHQVVIASGLNETMELTRRALEASGWLKRYTQGVLRVSATGDDPQHVEAP